MDTDAFEQLTFEGQAGENADLPKENMTVKVWCTGIARSTSTAQRPFRRDAEPGFEVICQAAPCHP
jgi:hypothetical protein